MIENVFLERLEAEFPFPFTPSQSAAAAQLAAFLFSGAERPAFILRGYAGTGKTTLVGSVVKLLLRAKYNVVLLAPTGRAAKVFAAHAGAPAYTIHKEIYRQKAFDGDESRFDLGFNKQQRTLFIVDEASMISNEFNPSSAFGTGCLLADLVRYVFSAEGCRLLLLGDRAQLPPVGEDESPALMREVLEFYGLTVDEADLTDVVRQSEGSDVLTAATRLRLLMADDFDGLPKVEGAEGGEVQFLPGSELIETLVSAYQDCGEDDTIVVTRSNKRANAYNMGIRATIFDREGEPTRGDRIMVVKNNYFWAEKLAKEQAADMGEDAPALPFSFIANGDTAEILRIRNFHEQHGFHFADATLRFPDYNDFEMDCRLLLDTLTSESPSLTADESRRLFDSVQQDYAHLRTKKERMEAIRADAYYNALQIKFAYAVTCHKAQGGQWSRVFVDQGYLPPESIGRDYLRWLYTAFTRTTERLYLVNWPANQRA